MSSNAQKMKRKNKNDKPAPSQTQVQRGKTYEKWRGVCCVVTAPKVGQTWYQTRRKKKKSRVRRSDLVREAAGLSGAAANVVRIIENQKWKRKGL